MKPIFDDEDSRDNGKQSAKCRLFHLEEVYKNFDERQYVLEISVHNFEHMYWIKKFSELTLFGSKNNGTAIRKAIEKFDLFCGQWFDTGDSNG